MNKLLSVGKQAFLTLKIMARAVFSPLISVVAKAHKGERISLSLLGFAAWRLVVWVAFVTCALGSVGVPAIIAYLFLIDVLIVTGQAVFFAIDETKGNDHTVA